VGQHSVRVGIVAGVLVGAALTAAIAVTDHDDRVTITVSAPCKNPAPLLRGDHAWDTTDAAPSQWGVGPERGTFTIVRPGEAVFRSDRDGRAVTLHENPSRFTQLRCTVGPR